MASTTIKSLNGRTIIKQDSGFVIDSPLWKMGPFDTLAEAVFAYDVGVSVQEQLTEQAETKSIDIPVEMSVAETIARYDTHTRTGRRSRTKNIAEKYTRLAFGVNYPPNVEECEFIINALKNEKNTHWLREKITSSGNHTLNREIASFLRRIAYELIPEFATAHHINVQWFDSVYDKTRDKKRTPNYYPIKITLLNHTEPDQHLKLLAQLYAYAPLRTCEYMNLTYAEQDGMNSMIPGRIRLYDHKSSWTGHGLREIIIEDITTNRMIEAIRKTDVPFLEGHKVHTLRRYLEHITGYDNTTVRRSYLNYTKTGENAPEIAWNVGGHGLPVQEKYYHNT